ncbi:PP2C family protein-serine/threonine phosphatase [Aliiglaciecola lipolytica]|uniref:Phosphatase n=1 Tax=Aliiglaciecola lipolytica E3 TaxID=1127673 RepID=K6Y7W7_9ALTE|nr:PP2C family serine/threonine-protein phosphatase [Aliiglaciecola lipolytica]GAC12758.1 phosphatase [Aliiglaciecola lipolytica E3]
MSNNRIIFEKSEQAGRDYNQDRFACHLSEQNDDVFIVVADGVGGTKQGELAAEIIASKSEEFWQTRSNFANGEALLNAFATQCNLAIRKTCEQGTSTAATLTALLQLNGELVTAHAGDSRIYQFDENGKVNQTKDHSLAYAKFLMGEIREDELATHPSQTQLLNCLDGSEAVQCEINHWQLADGEFFVLCSDGFWEIFNNDEILELIKNDNREYIFANRLDDTLQIKPGQDNTTVVLCELDKSKAVMASEQSSANAAKTQPTAHVADVSHAQAAAETAPHTQASQTSGVSLKVVLLAIVAIALLVLLYFTYRHYTQPCCGPESQILNADEFETTDASPEQQQSQGENNLKELTAEPNVVVDESTQLADELENAPENDISDDSILQNPEEDTPLNEASDEMDDKVEESKKASSRAAKEVKQKVESEVKDQADQLNNDEQAATQNFAANSEVAEIVASDEQGNPQAIPDLNANLDSAPDLALDIAAGEDPVAKLEERLTQDGSIAKGSKLTKTDEMKDQYAEIVTVQLTVNNTPVYGAILRYQKTPSGLEIISGKVSNLPSVPASPTHDFASCFAQYQTAQTKQNNTVQKGKSTPTLYIDSASAGYFWLTDIVVKETGQAFDLFLLDSSCDSLRLVPRHVSN